MSEIPSNWIHLTNANCFYDRVSNYTFTKLNKWAFVNFQLIFRLSCTQMCSVMWPILSWWCLANMEAQYWSMTRSQWPSTRAVENRFLVGSGTMVLLWLLDVILFAFCLKHKLSSVFDLFRIMKLIINYE